MSHLAKKCRVCGCTDESACIVVGTIPCIWCEEHDLCSACAPLPVLMAHEATHLWMLSVVGVDHAMTVAKLAQQSPMGRQLGLVVPDYEEVIVGP